MNGKILGMSQEGWIIQLFAFLHLGVALGCRAAGLSDELMLTLLSMLLVVILCLRLRRSVRFMAVSIVVVNIVGIVLGKGTAALFSLVSSSPLVVFPLSTFLSTEIIGWTTYAAARISVRCRPTVSGTGAGSIKWFMIAFVTIVITRLAILLLFSESLESQNTMISILLDYLFTMAVVLFLAEYATKLQTRAQLATEDANRAQYRYMKLKQQVNPHFLFNSLNVLDCMIQEQSAEDASRYTHKLAEIYRYMIKNEEETTVKLRDEMEFVGKYVDLLKVRFPKGLEVIVEIPEEDMQRSIVPCCVQLLIENATKHNAVRPENPLVITIRTTRNSVIVTNNLCPKVTRATSTGLGLKYIRQQYKDLSGKMIQVRETEGSYSVILPLL